MSLRRSVNKKNNPKIKKIGVITRPKTPIKEVFLKIRDAFLENHIELFLEKSCAQDLQFDGFEMQYLKENMDAMASLGGDGTLLWLCRELYGSNIGAFGINVGNLGFLTAISPNQSQEFSKQLSQGDYSLESHMMLEAIVNSKSYFAINEFLIGQDSPVRGILEILAYVDKNLFNAYRADSLIIATPTGSTAYNISAGGSIFYPLCKNILLTPVAPHGLTQRPMAVDDSFVFNFKVTKPATLLMDGQESIPLTPQTSLTIKAARNNATLIQPKMRSYFQILKEKFQWGQSQASELKNQDKNL